MCDILTNDLGEKKRNRFVVGTPKAFYNDIFSDSVIYLALWNLTAH